MIHILIGLWALCFSFGVSAQVNLDPSWVYMPPSFNVPWQSYQIDLGYSYFQTDSRYNVDGTEITQQENESYDKTEFDGLLRYGLSRQFELRGGFRYRRNNSSEIYNGAQVDHTEAGLESLVGGLKYTIPHKMLMFALDLSVRQTTFSNATYSSSDPTAFIVLGDEGTFFEVGGHITYPISKSWFLSGYLGYVFPPEELSQEVHALGELGIKWGRISLSGGVEMVESLNTDSYTDDPQNKPPIGNGATNLYNSINRSFLRPYIGASLAFNPHWKVAVKGSTIMNPVSTDQGTEFSVNLIYRSKGISSESLILHKFKEYIVEASVIKVSPRGKFVKIDKGLAHDVVKGMVIDFYKIDFQGGNLLVARGLVYEVSSDTAIVKLQKVYQNMRVLPGFVARGN